MFSVALLCGKYDTIAFLMNEQEKVDSLRCVSVFVCEAVVAGAGAVEVSAAQRRGHR